jgi:hypothetical protein
MGRIRASRPSPALVVATVAVVAAVTGSAIADPGASTSVLGTKQIKKLIKKEVAKRTGPIGPAGPAGPAGTNGVDGTARAYALVDNDSCDILSVCDAEKSKGISSVNRLSVGSYCVTAPGIEATETAAVATVERGLTAEPAGNASASIDLLGCGPTAEGFLVVTQRQPQIAVNQGAGTNNATVSGPAASANDIAFTIVIP